MKGCTSGTYPYDRYAVLSCPSQYCVQLNLHAGLGNPTSSTPRSDPTALHLAVRRHAPVSTCSSGGLCLLLILRLQQVNVASSIGFGPREQSVQLEKSRGHTHCNRRIDTHVLQDIQNVLSLCMYIRS